MMISIVDFLLGWVAGGGATKWRNPGRRSAVAESHHHDGSAGGVTFRGFGLRPPTPATQANSRPATSLAGLLACLLLIGGCRGIPFGPRLATVPDEHTVRAGNLVLVSNFQLPSDDPLVNELVELREQVVTTLNLPEPRRDVKIYLFSNEEYYRKYLDQIHPGLPDRRAYFVGTSSELAVYTYWGNRIQEDLRHEATHGILHASLSGVPLWLDEGLAEYFEVPSTPLGGMNGDYPQQLAVATTNGWRPDLQRLEGIEKFAELRRIDYQESWAWVHYLLHASPETRQQLLSYIDDLRDSPQPPPLSGRLADLTPSFSDRFLSYVGNLGTTGSAVIRASSDL